MSPGPWGRARVLSLSVDAGAPRAGSSLGRAQEAVAERFAVEVLRQFGHCRFCGALLCAEPDAYRGHCSKARCRKAVAVAGALMALAVLQTKQRRDLCAAKLT